MRRKDREMNREFGLKIIDKAGYGVLSMLDGDQPYGLPLSLVRDGDCLYFHSAKEGRKVKALQENANVSIVFVGHINIPDNYSEAKLQEIAEDETQAALLISNVFTTEYESAVVRGKVKLLDDKKEQIHAMRLVCEKYTPHKMAYFDLAIKAGLKRVAVYKVEIETITAKRKKYDACGKEMKWGRM